MEISPYFLSLLVLYSFLFGGVVGVLNDLHRLTRILLGVRYSQKRFERLYQARLPLVGRSVGEIGTGGFRRIALPVLLFLQDVLLFSFAAVGVAVLNFYFNHGQFRIYTVVAVLLGFLLYYFTVGKLVMLFSEGIVCLLRMALTIFLFLVTRPFVYLWRGICAVSEKIVRKIREAIANRRKKVYNIRVSRQLLKEAENGFLSSAGMLSMEIDKETEDGKE